MAYIIELEHHTDERGTLTVVDNVLPFEIKRTYYITNVKNSERGGHRHKKLVEGIICMNGSFTAFIDDGKKKQEIVLDRPEKCLIIEVGEWHHFYNFSDGGVLVALASTNYDHDDYIYEPYTY